MLLLLLPPRGSSGATQKACHPALGTLVATMCCPVGVRRVSSGNNTSASQARTVSKCARTEAWPAPHTVALGVGAHRRNAPSHIAGTLCIARAPRPPARGGTGVRSGGVGYPRGKGR